MQITSERASHWAAGSRGSTNTLIAVWSRLEPAVGQQSRGCVVQISGLTETVPEFPGFSDAMMKALAPVGSPLMQCVVISERAPWVLFTEDRGCSFERQRASIPSRLDPTPFGNLCLSFPEIEIRPALDPELQLEWRGPDEIRVRNLSSLGD